MKDKVNQLVSLAKHLSAAKETAELLGIIGFSYSKHFQSFAVHVPSFRELHELGEIKFGLRIGDDIYPVEATVNYEGVPFFTLLTDKEARQVWPEYEKFAKEAC